MKRNLLIILIVLFVSCFVVSFSKSAQYEISKRLNYISAGSYSHAEEYNIASSEDQVIEAITKLKEKNPQFVVPNVTIQNSGSFPLEDHVSNNNSFVVYFYEPIENKILQIAICGNETNSSILFNSVNDGLDIGNWKDINDDFPYKENEILKKQFEINYLDKIHKLVKKK